MAHDITIETDGGITCDMPFVSWSPGDGTATLDGDFTVAQLRMIVDQMASFGAPHQATPTQ